MKERGNTRFKRARTILEMFAGVYGEGDPAIPAIPSILVGVGGVLPYCHYPE